MVGRSRRKPEQVSTAQKKMVKPGPSTRLTPPPIPLMKPDALPAHEAAPTKTATIAIRWIARDQNPRVRTLRGTLCSLIVVSPAPGR
jgi:hypothetical protein